jgi:hypothetical protein
MILFSLSLSILLSLCFSFSASLRLGGEIFLSDTQINFTEYCARRQISILNAPRRRLLCAVTAIK